MNHDRVLATGLMLLASSCAPDIDDLSETSETLGGPRSVLIQRGTNLITYGVTDDGFTIFQDGGSLFASRLSPGAERIFVTDVGSVQPTVVISRRVALIWTTQFYFGRGGVSPLVVWTADGGAKQASAASIISLNGAREAAVSPDSRQIIFIDNASAGGTVGDIVLAAPDLSWRRTLATGVQIDLTAICQPTVGFDGFPGDDRPLPRHPVIAYCPVGATSATLARVIGGRLVELATDVSVPTAVTAPILWSSDALGLRFFTIVGPNRTPVVTSTFGARRIVLSDRVARYGFFNINGDLLVSLVNNPGPNRELHRFRGSSFQNDEVVADLGPGGLHIGHLAQGFRSYTDIPASPDGRFLLTLTRFDPTFGFSDINLVKIAGRPAPATALQSDPVVFGAFELFTTDSSHALYYTFDLNTFNPTLWAGSASGENRPISSGDATEFVHYGMVGSLVAYSDHLVGSGIDLTGDTHDIVVADVGAETIAPFTIAEGVQNLFFVTRDRRSVVYTTNNHPTQPGLYVAQVR